MADVQATFDMEQDSRVNKYTHDGGVKSIEEVTLKIQGVIADYDRYGYGRLAMVEKTSGKFIGFSGLKHIEEFDETDIGFRLHPDFWGKGLATESALAVLKYGFRDLKLNEIVGYVLPDNLSSINVLEKIGMVLKGSREVDGVLARKYGISTANHKNPHF